MSFSSESHKVFLNSITVASFSILLAIFFMFMSPVHAYAAGISASELIQLTNQDRATEGLGAVTVNEKLTQAAQSKANDEAASGYFAHTSPDGTTSWYWFKQAGYAYSHAGENLAEGFTDSTAVNEGWMHSPTHRANIMNGKFTEIGIASASGTYQGQQVIFVVQMFGTPLGNSVATVTSVPAPVKIAVAGTPAVTKVLGTETDAVPAPTPAPAKIAIISAHAGRTVQKKRVLVASAVAVPVPASEPASAPPPDVATILNQAVPTPSRSAIPVMTYAFGASLAAAFSALYVVRSRMLKTRRFRA